MKNNFKIVFLGTPSFAEMTLKALVDNDLKPFLVITQPDKPSGRKQELTPPPVKILAEKNGIEVRQPANKNELKEIFKDLDVDVCVLVAFGMIIPQEVLDASKKGFINVHPSLLPLYRGPSPVQAALLNGDEKTGVTVMQLTAGMDEGPIIKQKEVNIKKSDNFLDLHNELSELGAKMVVDVLPDYVQDKIKLVEQDHAKATYCKIINRQDGLIDWSDGSEKIFNQFRAFSPWPGVFTLYQGKRLKITDLKPLEGDFEPNLAIGELFLANKKDLAVHCGAGVVKLVEVQLEGKKAQSGWDFYNGHKDIIGTTLGESK